MRTLIFLLLSFFCVEGFAAPCETCSAHSRVKKTKQTAKKKVIKKRSGKDSNTIKISDNPRHFPPPGSSGQGKNMDFYYKRAFPNTHFDPQLYLDALDQAKALPLYRPGGGSQTQQAEMIWKPVGPYTIGGRVTSIATHPTDSNLFYVGAAAGGLWKTTDHGNTWRSLTDTFAFLSVGYVTLDPHNPNVIYIGLGEPNNSADSYPGNGVWRSIDGGESWTSLGLAKTQYIAKIIIDPIDSNTIYVAAPGPSAGADSNRGVWKSIDRGLTWTRSFFLRAGTLKTSTPVSVVDLVMNPNDEKQLVVCAWDNRSTSGGIYTSLWLTKDGGKLWNRFDTLSPTYPSGLHRGRFSRGSILWANNSIGVPTLYSVITKVDVNAVTGSLTDDNLFGIYKTTNPEGEWTKVLDSTYRIPYRGNNVDSADLFYRQGSYNNFIVGHPMRPDEVYVGGIDVIRTTDGGFSWTNITRSYPAYFNNDRRQHSDQHALAFTSAKSGDDLLNGSDGGVFHTRDYGSSWTQMKGMPITMFYHLEPWIAGMTHLGDNFPPDSIKLIGGTQDNGTLAHGFSVNSDWDWINRGDGGHSQTDPSNKNHIVTSLQLGKIFVRTTLDSLRPNLFSDNGNNDPNTKKWFDLSSIAKRRAITDSSEPCSFIPPVVLDKQRPNELYTGRTHIYRSKIDYSDPDSGTVIQRWSPQIVGVSNSPKTWFYGGNTEALALGVRDENGRPMIWAGGVSASRDTNGNLINGSTSLYRTTYNPTLHADSMPTWVKSSGSLPFGLVSAIVCDRSDSLTAFAGMINYGGTVIKKLYKTIDGGKKWIQIAGIAPNALPNAPLSAIVIDSLAEQGNPAAKNQCIIVAMDVGVFVTTDGGKKWAKLGVGMPNIVVNSITMYKNWLIAGTHGRSAWALDISSLQAEPVMSVRSANASINSSVKIESLSPNPLSLRDQSQLVTINVRISDNVSPRVAIDVINVATGAVVMHHNGEVRGVGEKQQTQFVLPSTIASGAYSIRVSDSERGYDEERLVIVR